VSQLPLFPEPVWVPEPSYHDPWAPHGPYTEQCGPPPFSAWLPVLTSLGEGKVIRPVLGTRRANAQERGVLAWQIEVLLSDGRHRTFWPENVVPLEVRVSPP
jgi:hypothetical protein